MTTTQTAHVRGELAAYLAGELGPGERAAVRAHLAGCAGCAAYAAELAAAEGALRAGFAYAPALADPARAWAKVQAARHTRASGQALRPAWRLAALALTTLVVVGLAAPGVRAQLGAAVQQVVRLLVPRTGTEVVLEGFTAFTPLMPSYLPEGFDLTTTGVQRVGEADILRLVFERDGEVVVLVQGPAAAMPRGLTGLSVPLKDGEAVLADSLAGVDPSTLAGFADGAPKRLAWQQGTLRVELFAELSLEEMVRIAEGLAAAGH